MSKDVDIATAVDSKILTATPVEKYVDSWTWKYCIVAKFPDFSSTSSKNARFNRRFEKLAIWKVDIDSVANQ